MIATCVTVRMCASFAVRSYPQDSRGQLVLHTTVLSVSVCVVGLTLLGATGLLSRPTLLLAPPLVAWLLSRVRCSPTVGNRTDNEPRLATWLWSGIGGLIVGHSIVNGVLTFPVDYDCLMYHLPLIDIWIQTGSFAATESPRWSDSANSEVLGLWFCGAFSGDFFAPLNNLPVLVVWVAGLLELARQFGVGGWWRHFVAVASIAVYTTVHETDDASNDLMVVAFFVAGLTYALRYRNSQAAADRLLVGLSLGVLAGTKFFATGYALLLGLTFFAMVVSSRGWRTAIRDGVATVAISLPVGGYWYSRNYVMTGHVFFPSGSSVLHERIAHPDIVKTTLAFNGDSNVPSLLMDAIWRHCGPIHFVIILLLPTILLILTLATYRRWKQGDGPFEPWLILIATLMMTCLISMTTPMLVEDQPDTLNHLRWGYTPIRYSLCCLTLAVLSTGLLLQMITAQLPRLAAQVIVAGLLAVAIWQLLFRFDSRSELDLNFAMAVGAVVVVLFHVALELWQRSRWANSILWAVFLIGVPALTKQVSTVWHAGFAAHYNAFYSTHSFTDELSRAQERILVLDERSSPFFGSAREHYVLHASNYRDLDNVRDIVKEHSITLIVTRVDTVPRKISRYRPAWRDLDVADDFRRVGEGRELRFYRPTLSEPSEVELSPRECQEP